MCGIAGLYRLTGCPTPEDVAAVVRMMDAEVHRGPDDWGLLVPDAIAGAVSLCAPHGVGDRDQLRAYPYAGPGPGVVLGTRRLSILDLGLRARMPMGTADGRLWITHNGEAYNYRELRAELAGGGAFRSQADTEAILRGWQAWGDAVLPRLRGMFAFAVFEAWPVARLFLARDRFGIKPLYYYRDRERLIFASEVRALLRSGVVPDEADPEAVVRFLQWGALPAPRTTINGVRALPAGHWLMAEAKGGAPRRYWQLATPDQTGPSPAGPVRADEAVASTRALLEESVGLHLVSDVPLGVFLSGGIDSSALVALASRLRGEGLTTLSMVFEEPAWSEASYARLIAERYRTDHREVLLRSRDFFDGLPRALRSMDQPTVDGMNTYFISAAARQAGLTVVLSGLGGDEVFLGYQHLRRGAVLDRARRLLGTIPLAARRGVLRLAAAGGLAMGRRGLEKLEYLERPSLANIYVMVRGLFNPGQIQDLLGMSRAELEGYGAPMPRAPELVGRSVVDSLALLDMTHYMQDQLLRDTDVMSMAHSVETRVPYLDHRLVEYVAGLPAALKLDRHRSKPLLLDSLGDQLPRQVWNRPKMGFTMPFQSWMRQGLVDLRSASLEGTHLERKAVEAVWSGFSAGRVHWSRAWALVVLARFGDGWRKAA